MEIKFHFKSNDIKNNFKNNFSLVFYRKTVPKNFVKFNGKLERWSSHFSKFS